VELSKLGVLLEKHEHALGLLQIGVAFGYLPILAFSVPDIIQPSSLVGMLDNVLITSVVTIFLATSATLAHKVFSYICVIVKIEYKNILCSADKSYFSELAD